MKVQSFLLATVLFRILSADTITISEESEYYNRYPQINPPRKNIRTLLEGNSPSPGNEQFITNCDDCPQIYRNWVTSEKILHKAAYFCGFDYIALRFTHSFSNELLQSTIVVHTHSTRQGDSIIVDSVTTTFRNTHSANETTLHFPAYKRAPHLPLPSLYPKQTDPLQHLNKIISVASGFQTQCALSSEGTPAWSFNLQGQCFIIHNGELHSKPSTATATSTTTPDIAYRLATWGTTSYASSPYARDHALPPSLQLLSVNDSESIILADISATSDYGLSSCIISSGSINDTVKLFPATKWNHRITVNALPEDTLLTIFITDIHGNSAKRTRPIFTKQHERTASRQEQREIELYTKESTQHNPMLYGTWLLSQFSGNPISYFAKKALDHTSKKKSPQCVISQHYHPPIRLFFRRTESFMHHDSTVPPETIPFLSSRIPFLTMVRR